MTSAVTFKFSGSPLVPRAYRSASWFIFVAMGLIVLSFLFSWRATAQSFRPSTDVPAAWTAFAKSLQMQSQTVLRGDDEVARRLQVHLEKLRVANPNMPPLALTIRMWVDANGRVQPVAHPPLLEPAANADLKTLLARVAAGPPPAGMLQPVHLRLSLELRQ
ncbi:hypothetical protein [Hyphomicrobium sp. CS1BSMeth3]|uniref:hypothetical protein n=1 Tax=Hyphomicrobium sp. CS1BSMeth3 TaxID=1892844 RepID=UPI001160AC5A|nr:hypothetical protein [Hyphomicrobium sp. CS1BSMeth3]